ncbi:hypothetical protein V1264_011725 [Littorina saxatilis]|uniref:Uncharacterized protein n=1 Tax=Littorina saxatilis TaxID=31220 RepID=A0AAN9GLE1_9CAEN
MMWIFAHALLFPFLLLVPGGVDALSWVPPGPVEEVRKYDLCEGQNLSVPWNLTTDPLENIVSIKWTWKSGATSEERELASLLPGDSVNATDSRVGHVGSAGITINNVSASDTGDIEVKVTLQNQSSQLVVTHVARLLVMVGPDLENEKLTLEVDYTPYQTKTGVSYATLRCGRFRHRGVPTVHPMIETPDGQSVSIAAHNDHEYIYPLDPDSTTVGRYRCQLPAKNVCQDADLRSNVVDVKANDIRLNKLEHLLSQLQQEHDHDKQTLQNTLKQTKQEQDQTKQTLQNTQQGLKQTKQELKQTKQEQDQTKQTLQNTQQGLKQTKQELKQAKQEQDQTKQTLQNTQQGLKQTKQELNQAKQEQDQTKQTLQNTQQGLKQTKQELNQAKQEQDQTKQTLQNTQQGLKQTKQELNQAKQEQDQTKQELEQTKKTLEGVKRDVQRKYLASVSSERHSVMLRVVSGLPVI